MTTAALNNLWTYLQGLTLTTSNMQWLADHLYEATREQGNTKNPVRQMQLRLEKEDLVLSPEMLEPIKDLTPLPQDFDINQARANYIMAKHG